MKKVMQERATSTYYLARFAKNCMKMKKIGLRGWGVQNFTMFVFTESIVKLLIENGADCVVENRRHQTPFMVAHNIRVARLLSDAAKRYKVSHNINIRKLYRNEILSPRIIGGTPTHLALFIFQHTFPDVEFSFGCSLLFLWSLFTVLHFLSKK